MGKIHIFGLFTATVARMIIEITVKPLKMDSNTNYNVTVVPKIIQNSIPQ